MVKKQGKITVKHYLNKRAKVRLIGKEKYYPLYIQIIVAGHKAQLKSKISDFTGEYSDIIESNYANRDLTDFIHNGYFSQTFLDRVFYENDFPLATLLRDEINILRKIILMQDPFSNPAFGLINFSQHYHLYITDINDLLTHNVSKKFTASLRLLMKTGLSGKNEDLKKLIHFLLNHARWEDSFYSFYRSAMSIFPEQLKSLREQLPVRLQEELEAILVFGSNYDIIREKLSKTDKGLIPEINYFDWKEEVRTMLDDLLKTEMDKQTATGHFGTIERLIHEELEQNQSA